jgi:hypothetical protein
VYETPLINNTLLKKLYISLFVDDLLDSSAIAAPVIHEPLKKKLLRDLARLTIFSYILYFLNPVMPIIADKMAHTFWEEYHLITVHGIYGKFHVEMQLDKTEKQSDKDKSARNNKAGSEEYFHVTSIATDHFLGGKYIARSYTPYKFYSPASYPDVDYLPPKA